MVKFRVAAAQYPIDFLPDWAAFEAKLAGWIAKAAEAGASLAIFPEYGSMELASLDPASAGDLAMSLAFVASQLPRVDRLHADLAKRHNLHILAASAPRLDADGCYRNAARLFGPDGYLGTQDKIVMTRFEREQWGISPGKALRVFDTTLGRLAVNICYDSEFPLLARAQIESGAQVILVPSCTDTEHGYWRVRIGAQARALEGQCFVVQSATIGSAAWSPAVDENIGVAGVYGPPDGSFPANGVLALGEINSANWLYCDIDTDMLEDIRNNGQVYNRRDWDETTDYWADL